MCLSISMLIRANITVVSPISICSSVGVFVTVAISERFPCAPLEGGVALCRACGAQCWAGSLLPALGEGRVFPAGQVQRREVLILRYFEKP